MPRAPASKKDVDGRASATTFVDVAPVRPSLPALASYGELLRRYPRVIGFGVLSSSLGGLGQTFFISLFVPAILAAFALERTSFGALYAVATVGAALLLPFAGKQIDRATLRMYAVVTGLALGLACALIALATELWVLFAGLLVLRLCGQGLLGHISATSMARFFTAGRGRALGLASLGHPLAEATLPLLGTSLLLALGFRNVWLLAALACLAAYVPLTLWLLGGRDTSPAGFHAEEPPSSSPASTLPLVDASWTRGELLLDPRFWLLLPWFLVPAFVLTGLFFHQLDLAAEKGWSAAWIASSFFGYAAGRSALSFLSGPLVDRFTARRVLPFHQVPLLLGLVALGVSSVPAVSWVYLLLAGVTVGIGVNAKAAYYAEAFGTRHIGAIRSVTLALGVLSTAVSPPLFGWLLDKGLSFAALALWLAALSALVTGVGWAAVSHLARHPLPSGRWSSGDSAKERQ
jgi:MFS family permease